MEGDDLLLLRFLFLYVISEMVRSAKGEDKKVEFLVEQPADPTNYPEVVTLWRTDQWKRLKKSHGLTTQTFNQSEFGTTPTKPTTVGGTIQVAVPLQGRKGIPRDVQGKSAEEICNDSRRLSRWPPLLMRAIAVQLQLRAFAGSIKMRMLSWAEHVAVGHTPFRKDCKVRQQASAKDMPHRRSPLPPRVGVLSVDMSGPYHRAPDVHRGKHAKFLLVGCFTWFAKDQDGPDVQDVPDEEEPHPEAPELDDLEAVEQERIEREREEEGRPRRGRPRNQEPELELHGPPIPVDPPRPEDLIEQREDVKIEVHRMCVPLPGKGHQGVLRAIIDMYLRLKADGFTITQLHSDMGGEFVSQALEDWCKSRCILKTTTLGDAPQTNGRAEVSVQRVKSAVKRILHGAGVGTERWPLAARFFNEKDPTFSSEGSD